MAVNYPAYQRAYNLFTLSAKYISNEEAIAKETTIRLLRAKACEADKMISLLLKEKMDEAGLRREAEELGDAYKGIHWDSLEMILEETLFAGRVHVDPKDRMRQYLIYKDEILTCD